MAVRKIGARWMVDIRYGGVRHRVRSPGVTKGDAHAHEMYLRGELAKHGALPREPARPGSNAPLVTLRDFAERWMALYVRVNNKPSEANAKRYMLNARLLPAFGHRPLAAITAAEIESFKTRLARDKLSAKTINNHLTVLRKCLATAQEWDELLALPRIRFLKTARPDVSCLSDGELKRLLGAIKDPRWQAMVLLAASTGLRVGEILAVTWSDVDLSRRVLHVRRSIVRGHMGSTKTYALRAIPLGEAATAALNRLEQRGAYVFPVRWHPMSYHWALERLHGFCHDAGIRRIGWHVLRHTFASRLAAAGAPMRSIQALLGHSGMEMTLRYTHSNDEMLRSAVALLDAEPEQPWAPGGHGALLPSPREELSPAASSAKIAQEKPPLVRRLSMVGGQGFEPEGG